MLISLLILWTLVTLLAGTSAIAVRGASRTRLIVALKRRGRENSIVKFELHRHEYALTALVLRQLGIVLFVITTSVLLPATHPWWRHPLEVFLIAASWSLIFAAAIPVAWARYAGETHIVNVLWMLEVSRRVGRPLLRLMHGIDEVVRRLAGVPREEADQTVKMEREILDVVSHADAEGPVDESEKAMIKSVMAMDEKSAGQIMTPRTDVIGIEVNAGYEDARELVVRAAHSRIPVYEDTLDHVVGVLFAKDLLRVTDPTAFSLRDMMRSVSFVPETKDLTSLLREFQSARVHMNIVLDEYGGTAGLVTIEDILEELVGEIADEHDEPVNPPIQRIGDNVVDVDARVRVEELNEALGLSLPEDEGYDTIAGYVFSKLGKIPTAGEAVTSDNVSVQVLTATDRSLVRLRVRILDSAANEVSA